MKSAILFLCFSGLVMGYDETCKAKGESCVAPEDEVELMQIRTQVHKHNHSMTTNTDMHEVLASFEEEKGPVALQELMQGLMVLPMSKSEEDMLAAVHAQPQLQHLAKRYPDFMHTLGIFEDTKAIPQIKAAVFTLKAQGHRPSVAAPARRMPGNTTLLGLSGEPSAIMAWVESYSCTATLGFTDFPDASEGIKSNPLFGPDCQGQPWILSLAVRPKDEGAFFVFGNYSAETSKTMYSLGFVGETGYKELGSLGSSLTSSAFGVDALYYISVSGDWPNRTYNLMSATPEAVSDLLNITSCNHPNALTSVPRSNTMIWSCNKDWSKPDDTHKVMKYSVGAGTPEILLESQDHFGKLTIAGSQLYWGKYEKKSNSSSGSHYVVYSCPLAKCDPVKVGALPEGVYGDFVVTESGELVTTGYNSWELRSSRGKERWTTYNVTVSSLDDSGASHTLPFQIRGNSYLQVVPITPGPEDIDDEAAVGDVAAGLAGPPGPPGPPGPAGQ